MEKQVLEVRETEEDFCDKEKLKAVRKAFEEYNVILMTDYLIAPTGFAKDGRQILSYLLFNFKLKHEKIFKEIKSTNFFHIALGYTGEEKDNLLPFKVYPCDNGRGSRFGEGNLADIFKDIRKVSKRTKNILITNFDIQMVGYLSTPSFRPDLRADVEKLVRKFLRNKSYRHITRFPIDGMAYDGTMPFSLQKILKNMKNPLGFSKFSQNVFKDVRKIPIIYNGIDTDVKMYSHRNKKEIRKILHLPEDVFIIGMVGVNRERKDYPRFFEICKKFIDKNKKRNILIFPFCELSSKEGWFLKELTIKMGIRKNIIVPNEMLGCPEKLMPFIYNAMDVHLLVTRGEGFGYPVIEAQACGIPSLTVDYSACPELYNETNDWQLIQPITYIIDKSGLKRPIINVEEAVNKLQRIYDDEEFTKELGEKNRKNAERFDYTRILPKYVEYFYDFFYED